MQAAQPPAQGNGSARSLPASLVAPGGSALPWRLLLLLLPGRGNGLPGPDGLRLLGCCSLQEPACCLSARAARGMPPLEQPEAPAASQVAQPRQEPGGSHLPRAQAAGGSGQEPGGQARECLSGVTAARRRQPRAQARAQAGLLPALAQAAC